MIKTFLFSVFLAILPVQSLAALSNADRTALPAKNYLSNGGAELSLTGTSGTPAATIVTGAGNVDDGGAAFAWDSASAGQTHTIQATAVTSGGGLSGRDTVLSCAFKCASGTCTHTLCLYDGTNETCQTIVSDTAKFVRSSVIHPAPTSGTLTARLKSVASNEPSVTRDSCRLERLDESRAVFGPTVTGAEAFTPTGSWVTNTTYTGYRWRVGDRAYFDVTLTLAGAPTSADLTVNLPVTIDTAKLPTASPSARQTIFGQVVGDDASGDPYYGAVHYSSTTAVAVKKVNTAGANAVQDTWNATTPTTWASGDKINLRFDVPVLGWEAVGSALTLDQFGTAWSGYQANTSGWASTGTTYANCNAGSPTLTERVNRNFGTVSNAAASDCGITFTPKKTGPMYVKAELAVLASVSLYGSAQMVDGSNNVIDPGRAINITSNNFGHMSLSGLISVTAGTPFTVRFRLAANTGTFQIFTGPVAGSTGIQWSVFDLSSFGAVSLANTITTRNAVGDAVARAAVSGAAGVDTTACTGTCFVNRSNGGAVTGVTRSATGTYSATILGGVFSDLPTCHFEMRNSDSHTCTTGSSAKTSTTIPVNCKTLGTVLPVDTAFEMTCIGPR